MLFFFGHVDLDFVLWYQLGKNPHMNIDRFLDEVVERYKDFLSNYENAYVMCPNLPTVQSDKFLECLTIHHSNILNNESLVVLENSISLPERTKICLSFICKLKKAFGSRAIDISDQLLDPNTGTIKSKYLRDSRLNHHPNKRVTVLWKKKLEGFFSREMITMD
jgi:hypothetical protein